MASRRGAYKVTIGSAVVSVIVAAGALGAAPSGALASHVPEPQATSATAEPFDPDLAYRPDVVSVGESYEVGRADADCGELDVDHIAIATFTTRAFELIVDSVVEFDLVPVAWEWSVTSPSGVSFSVLGPASGPEGLLPWSGAAVVASAQVGSPDGAVSPAPKTLTVTLAKGWWAIDAVSGVCGGLVTVHYRSSKPVGGEVQAEPPATDSTANVVPDAPAVSGADGLATAPVQGAGAKSSAKLVVARKKLVLTEGATARIGASATDTRGKKATVRWRTSNPRVARVSAAGKVKAKAPGRAILTASAAGKSVRVTVRVTSDR